MNAASADCAREVLETVPLLMRFIRHCVRRHPAPGPALPQFRTLTFLSRVKGPSLSETAAHLGLALPAMSRLANDLVKKGWVDRRAVATNRRQIALELTAAGRARLEEMRQAIRGQLAKGLAPLSASERDAIRRSMRALRRAFGPPPEKPGTHRGTKP